MKRLKKITPDNLIQTIVEIRFDINENIPSEAIFGMLYNILKDRYPNSSKSDILQIPEIIRNSDPTLRFQAHQTLFNDEVVVGISPSVVSFNCNKKYIGWERYYPIMQDEFKNIIDLKILKSIFRVGLRYISFFENYPNIFNYINMKLQFVNTTYNLEKTNIRTNISLDDYMSSIRISDKMKLQKDAEILDGSLDKHLENVHIKQKELFQNLLGDFINNFNPEYYDE